MKVERTGGPGTTAATRRSERSKPSSSFADALKEVESAAPVSGASAVTPISAVLAAQSVDQDAGSAGKARRRAEDILDRLDELRLGLIEGRLSPERIEALVALVAERRATVSDRRLRDILDDIDLRAQVELAKLGRAP